MKISYKLSLAFGTSLIVALLLVCLCLWQMARLQTMATSLIADAKNIALVTRSSAIGPMSLQTILTHVLTNDAERAEAEWTLDVKSTSESQIGQLKAISDTDEEKAKADSVKSNFETLVNKYEKDIIPLLKASKEITPEIKTKVLELYDPSQAISDNSLQLRNMVDADIKKHEEELIKSFKYILITTSGVSLASIILVIIMSVIITKSIVKPLQATTESARLLALGDISQKISFHSNNEIGKLADSFRAIIAYITNVADALNQLSQNNLTISVAPKSDVDKLAISLGILLNNWRTALIEISDNATNNLHSSQELSVSAESLSNTASSQAASLEEVSSAIREFSGQVQKNAESSEELEKLEQETTEASKVGQEKIGQTIAAINDIEASSKEIQRFIKVIDDIAFQTNLLALNAAVEAARAGKHGRGFAVVADEVRNLSNKSAEAAQEISEIIEVSSKKVAHGLTVTNQTAESFAKIITVIEKTTDHTKNVSELSRQQLNSISQITLALQQIDNSTQRNAAGAEETFAASSELLKQANGLKEIVGKFNL